MPDTDNFASPVRRTPWNKGKLIGARPPLRSKHVWSIRTRLQVEGRVRDLAMFNLAIDSKLRGCDVVSIKIVDVAPHGYALDRAAALKESVQAKGRAKVKEAVRKRSGKSPKEEPRPTASRARPTARRVVH